MNERFGFNYTENLDGVWEKNNKHNNSNKTKFYLNLKMITDQGGAQNRSFREVYWYIEAQYNYLLNFPDSNTYFVNICDGDTGYKYIYQNFDDEKASLKDIQLDKKYSTIKNKIYIGDMYNFNNWYTKIE